MKTMFKKIFSIFLLASAIGLSNNLFAMLPTGVIATNANDILAEFNKLNLDKIQYVLQKSRASNFDQDEIIKKFNKAADVTTGTLQNKKEVYFHLFYLDKELLKQNTLTFSGQSRKQYISIFDDNFVLETGTSQTSQTPTALKSNTTHTSATVNNAMNSDDEGNDQDYEDVDNQEDNELDFMPQSLTLHDVPNHAKHLFSSWIKESVMKDCAPFIPKQYKELISNIRNITSEQTEELLKILQRADAISNLLIDMQVFNSIQELYKYAPNCEQQKFDSLYSKLENDHQSLEDDEVFYLANITRNARKLKAKALIFSAPEDTEHVAVDASTDEQEDPAELSEDEEEVSNLELLGNLSSLIKLKAAEFVSNTKKSINTRVVNQLGENGKRKKNKGKGRAATLQASATVNTGEARTSDNNQGEQPKPSSSSNPTTVSEQQPQPQQQKSFFGLMYKVGESMTEYYQSALEVGHKMVDNPIQTGAQLIDQGLGIAAKVRTTATIGQLKKLIETKVEDSSEKEKLLKFLSDFNDNDCILYGETRRKLEGNIPDYLFTLLETGLKTAQSYAIQPEEGKTYTVENVKKMLQDKADNSQSEEEQESNNKLLVKFGEVVTKKQKTLKENENKFRNKEALLIEEINKVNKPQFSTAVLALKQLFDNGRKTQDEAQNELLAICGKNGVDESLNQMYITEAFTNACAARTELFNAKEDCNVIKSAEFLKICEAKQLDAREMVDILNKQEEQVSIPQEFKPPRKGLVHNLVNSWVAKQMGINTPSRKFLAKTCIYVAGVVIPLTIISKAVTRHFYVKIVEEKLKNDLSLAKEIAGEYDDAVLKDLLDAYDQAYSEERKADLLNEMAQRVADKTSFKEKCASIKKKYLTKQSAEVLQPVQDAKVDQAQTQAKESAAAS